MIPALLLALAPIAVMIALGAWLRTSHFVAEAFWPQAERLAYYVLLPSLFLHGLATANLSGLPVWTMAATLVCSLTVVALILVAIKPRLALSDPAFTSVFQGGVRFNNYVGVSAVAGLFGAQGIALAAVANAAIVPTANVLCVLVFARYIHDGTVSFKTVARQLATNPLLVACVAGIALQVSGLGLPPIAEPVFKALGQASLPLGLLCVGAALEFSSARKWVYPIGISSAAKFVLMPLVTIGACSLFGLHGPAAMAVLVFQTLPTASSSYILARQLGGDAPMMAGIVAVQTVIAGLAMPFTILSFSGLLDLS